VGLGGFVRFRSGLKDPRDAAILFLMIGLGMACGHGALELAAVGTAFVCVLLFVLELFGGKEAQPAQRIKVMAQSDDPVADEAMLRRAMGERNVIVKSCALDFDGRKLELEVEEREPGALSSALSTARAPSLRELRWAAAPSKGMKEEWV
jgi:uncharacterized membrane protein YhiD involved in acid resistance